MRAVVKRTLDQLEALGCQLDQKDRELRSDRWTFTHPNTPDETYRVNYRATEAALRIVVQRAKVAAGLATSDTLEKRKPKANHRARMEREAVARQRAAARKLREARESEERAARAAGEIERRRSELNRLLVGRGDGKSAEAVRAHAMLTAAEVADLTGCTDKEVRRAIESGALEAYQCGREVKVKGADVRRWIGGSAR